MSSSSTATDIAALPGLAGAKRATERLAFLDAGTHAVLFYGAEGAGKSHLARSLAAMWMCKDLQPSGACGQCASCAALARGASPDLLVIAPAKPSNIIRLGAFTRMPDETAWEPPLMEFLRTPPLQARRKVAIIFEADRMNTQASNTLLKTLEEPPPYAKLILTTAKVGHLAPTILSRCLAIACELPSETGRDPLTIMAEDAPARAEAMLPHREPYERLDAMARTLAQEPPQRALALAEEFREICEELSDSTGATARASYLEALRALGACIAAYAPRSEWMSHVAEAHRRIQGNGSAGIVLDALFSSLLLQSSEPSKGQEQADRTVS